MIPSRKIDIDLLGGVINGDLTEVQKAIDNGANVNFQTKGGWTSIQGETPLMVIIRIERESKRVYTEIVRLLLNHGANPNLQNKNGETALMNACQRPFNGEEVEFVKLLLDNGADPNLKTKTGSTALIDASGHTTSGKKFEIIKLLLDHGADPNVRYGDVIPLVDASDKGQIDIVRLLLDHGADPNFNNRRYLKRTALMCASFNDHTEIVQLLLDHGANPNIRTSVGTALMIAVKKGHTEIVKLLLEHGADPFITNFEGKNAMDLVKSPQMKHLLRTQNRRYLTSNMALNRPLHLPGPDTKSRTSLVHGSVMLPTEIRRKITSYLFQDLQSLKISQLRRVYQKVYGKKCQAKTKREILKILHRK